MQRSRLFQTIVVVGAALTGTAAGTAIVASTALLSEGCVAGCVPPVDMPREPRDFGVPLIDMQQDSHDLTMSLIDMQQDPRDLSSFDGGNAG